MRQVPPNCSIGPATRPEVSRSFSVKEVPSGFRWRDHNPAARPARVGDNSPRGESGTPKAVFLIGGPGDGKTEAVEFTIRALDESMNLGGMLIEEFGKPVSRPIGQSPGRLVRTERTQFPVQSKLQSIAIVQDEDPNLSKAIQPPLQLTCATTLTWILMGQRVRLCGVCEPRRPGRRADPCN